MNYFCKNIGHLFQENEDYENVLPTAVFEFMQSTKKMHMIRGGVVYRSNQKRKFETVTLSRVWTKDLDFYSLLKLTLDEIDFKAIISIDCDFIIECPDQEKPLKFQHASRGTAMNETKRVIIPSDTKKLLQEFADLTPSDILNRVFGVHSSILDYKESGFRPHSLLTFKIFITSLQ